MYPRSEPINVACICSLGRERALRDGSERREYVLHRYKDIGPRWRTERRSNKGTTGKENKATQDQGPAYAHTNTRYSVDRQGKGKGNEKKVYQMTSSAYPLFDHNWFRDVESWSANMSVLSAVCHMSGSNG